MRQNLRNAVIAVCAVLLVLAAGRLMAQTVYTGTITGTVKDTTGAVIPHAKVIVTNTATGVNSPVTTTSTGDYTVPNLIPGPYKVVVQAPGFGTEQVTGITLVVAQVARANAVLKPGATSATVTVTANAVELDTDTSAVSQLVSAQQITDLPLNGREFFDLLFIGAGAVTTGGEQGTGRFDKGAAIVINGERPESNVYLLDGILNTDQAINTPSTILSIDAIQEFKVLSETYSAQYGFGANQISVISKSGTNEFHGSLFEFDRNDFFDSKNYFFVPATGNTETLRQNQFGFVVDGPVKIPGLYSNNHKTFFMANYEGWRVYSTSGDTFTNVPTPAELAGDFTTPVNMPGTTTPYPGGTVNGTTYASIVPASSFSTFAKMAIAQGVFPAPTPHCASNPASCQNYNFSGPSKGSTVSNQQTYRIDEDMGKWGKLFGRGSYATINNFGWGGPSGTIAGAGIDEIDTNWAVGHTLNIGANKVNQFTMGLMDASAVNYGQTVGQSTLNSLGFNNVFTDLSALQRSYPTITFASDAQNLGTFGGSNNAYTGSDNPMWQFSDAFTYIRGAHTLTVGADYKKWTLYRNLADNFIGQFNFQDGIATGNALADFLLGTYQSANAFIPGPFSEPGTAGNQHDYEFKYFGTFVQDDWKANDKLTLNLGLRWDLRPVPHERYNRMGWLDSNNDLGGLCIADPALGTDGIAPAGNGFYRYCGGRHPGSTEFNNFGPRAGAAYRIDNKTVVRGGFGLFWDGIEGREMDNSGDIYPYVSRQSVQQFSGQTSYQTTNQLWPNFSSVAPVTGGYSGPDTFLAPMLTNTPMNPLVEQGSLSVERELARNTTLEVYYIGNKGSRLLDRQEINQAQPMVDPLATCYIYPMPASCGVVARRPYPNFDDFIEGNPIGYSNYNALNIKFEHRARNLAVTSVYTWSKSLDDKSTASQAGSDSFGWQGFLNNHNPTADYGRSDFNAGQRFVTSAVYNLPFGRGKQFANQISPALDKIIGGWEASGIYTAQQGFPFDVGCYEYYPVAIPASYGGGTAYYSGLLDIAEGYGLDRGNLIGSAKNFKLTLNPNDSATFAHNATIIGRNAPGEFGTEQRNALTMPGINNFVLGAYKNTNITERATFQLRLEAFNAFNHPSFDPDPSLNSYYALGAPDVNDVYDLGQMGLIGAAGPGRVVQISGKILF